MTDKYWFTDGKYCIRDGKYAFCAACPDGGGGASTDCCHDALTEDNLPATVTVVIDGLADNCGGYACSLLNDTYEVPFCDITTGFTARYVLDITDRGFLCGTGSTTFMFLLVRIHCTTGGDLAINVLISGGQTDKTGCVLPASTGNMEWEAVVDTTGMTCDEVLATPADLDFVSGTLVCDTSTTTVSVAGTATAPDFCDCAGGGGHPDLLATITASSCPALVSESVVLEWQSVVGFVNFIYYGTVVMGCGDTLEVWLWCKEDAPNMGEPMMQYTLTGPGDMTGSSGELVTADLTCDPFFVDHDFDTALGSLAGTNCCSTEPSSLDVTMEVEVAP